MSAPSAADAPPRADLNVFDPRLALLKRRGFHVDLYRGRATAICRGCGAPVLAILRESGVVAVACTAECAPPEEALRLLLVTTLEVAPFACLDPEEI